MHRTIRGRQRLGALILLLLLSVAGPSAAQAAQSVDKVHVTGPECAALVEASGRSAASACVVIVERGGATVRHGRTLAASTTGCYVPAGYTACGRTWVKSQSILLLWSVTSTATFVRNSNTGKVDWQSVTCTQSAFGYTVRIGWCGSYHSGLPDTNFGANFDVSFVWQGSPLTVSHGHRASVNGSTGSPCCTQGW